MRQKRILKKSPSVVSQSRTINEFTELADQQNIELETKLKSSAVEDSTRKQSPGEEPTGTKDAGSSTNSISQSNSSEISKKEECHSSFSTGNSSSTNGGVASQSACFRKPPPPPPPRNSSYHHNTRGRPNRQGRSYFKYGYYGPQDKSNHRCTRDNQFHTRHAKKSKNHNFNSCWRQRNSWHKRDSFYMDDNHRNTGVGSPMDTLPGSSRNRGPMDNDSNCAINRGQLNFGNEHSPKDNVSATTQQHLSNKLNVIDNGSPTDQPLSLAIGVSNHYNEERKTSGRRSLGESGGAGSVTNMSTNQSKLSRDHSPMDNISATCIKDQNHAENRSTRSPTDSASPNCLGIEKSSNNRLHSSRDGSPRDSQSSVSSITTVPVDNRHLTSVEGSPTGSFPTTSSVDGNQTVGQSLSLEGSSPKDNYPVEAVVNLGHTSSSQLNVQMRSPKDNAIAHQFPNISDTNRSLVVDPNESTTDCSLLRNVGDVPRTQDFVSAGAQSNSFVGNQRLDFDLLTQNIALTLQQGMIPSAGLPVSQVIRSEVARQLSFHNLQTITSPFAGDIQTQIRNEVANQIALMKALQFSSPVPSVVDPSSTKSFKKKKMNKKRREKRIEQSRKYNERKRAQMILDNSSYNTSVDCQTVNEDCNKSESDTKPAAILQKKEVDKITNVAASTSPMDVDSKLPNIPESVTGDVHNCDEEQSVTSCNSAPKEVSDFVDEEAVDCNKNNLDRKPAAVALKKKFDKNTNAAVSTTPMDVESKMPHIPVSATGGTKNCDQEDNVNLSQSCGKEAAVNVDEDTVMDDDTEEKSTHPVCDNSSEDLPKNSALNILHAQESSYEALDCSASTIVELKKKRELKDWPQSTEERNAMKKDIFMEELAEECEWTKNKSLKRLFTKWLSVFLNQIEDSRVYFKLVWTSSFSRMMVGLRIFSSKPDGIYPCMGHIANFLVGNIAGVQNQDLLGSCEYSTRMKGYCKSVYRDILSNKLLTFSDYRFLVDATNITYESRRDDLGLAKINSSIDLVKLCYGDKNEFSGTFQFESEEQYFNFKKEALHHAIEYLKNNFPKYPFEAVDHPANVGTDTENESETDYTVFKSGSIHRDKVIDTFSLLLMSNFEMTMRCPFSKEFQDCGDLYCCMLPERKCKSKTFENFNKFKSHAFGRTDVYHNVLNEYLDNFGQNYYTYIMYPNNWLPDGKLERSKIPFKSRQMYYDVKVSAMNLTNAYCAGTRSTLPFGQKKTYNGVSLFHTQIYGLMRFMFAYGFEASLQCPLSKVYQDQNFHSKLRNRFLPGCYECDFIQFRNVSDIRRHCNELDCQYHQLLAKYFEFFDEQSKTCLVASQSIVASPTSEVKNNPCTKK